MKKTISFTLLIVSTMLNLRAQGFYVGIKAGYGFSLAGSPIGSEYNYTEVNHYDGANQSNTSTTIQKTVQGSYGAGFTPALQAGYMITKNIGAELNIAYLVGNKYDSPHVNNTFNYYDSLGVYTQSLYNYSSKISVTSFYLNPALVFRLPMPGKIVPYAKIGIYLGLINQIKSESETSASSLNRYGSSTGTTGSGSGSSTGKINLGATASVGADYMVTQHFALFGEINIISAGLALKNFEGSSTTTVTYSDGTTSVNDSKSSGDYTDQVISNPNDYTSVITPVSGPGIYSGNTTTKTYSDGHTTTSTSINYTNGNRYTSSESKGVKQLTDNNLPLSSIGFSVGVRYFFGN